MMEYERLPPKLFGSPRETIAKCLCPGSICGMLFVIYTVLVLIYHVNMQSTSMSTDCIIFSVLAALLIISFVRAAYVSPGVVEKGWLRQYPELYHEIEQKWKETVETSNKQKELASRVTVLDPGSGNVKGILMSSQQTNTSNRNGNSSNNGLNQKLRKSRFDNSMKLEHIKEEENTKNTKYDFEFEVKINKNDGNRENEDFKDISDDSSETSMLLAGLSDIPIELQRPQRSHYCYEIGNNILKMDHYCVWFNNAVGLKNYKFFILTLFYLFLTCLFTCVVIVYRVFAVPILSDNDVFKMNVYYSLWRGISIFISIILSLAFCGFSSMHLTMHLYQMSLNMTSIEYAEFVRTKAAGIHLGLEAPETHKYDFGTFENFKLCLGDDWYFWLIPLKPKLSDNGYKFNVNKVNEMKVKQFGEKMEQTRENMYAAAGLGTIAAGLGSH